MTPKHSSSPGTNDESIQPETYYTDGTRLWEVVGLSDNGVVLEDMKNTSIAITLELDTFYEQLDRVLPGQEVVPA